MLVVIPVRECRSEESEVCLVTEAKMFAFVRVGDGMSIEEIECKERLGEQFFDYIVTIDKADSLEEAYDLGARALLARRGMRVEDVIDAMMFRELDEIV